MSLSSVELLWIIVAGILPVLVVGEEFWQWTRFTCLFRWRRGGIDET